MLTSRNYKRNNMLIIRILFPLLTYIVIIFILSVLNRLISRLYVFSSKSFVRIRCNTDILLSLSMCMYK